MGIWTPAEPPRSRPRRAWLFDGGVAVVALLGSSLYVTAAPALPGWAAVTIIAALAAPLVVRRSWPVPVFAGQLLVAAAAGWWAMQVVWSPALVIGLYTLAVRRPRRDAVVAAALLAGGCLASSVRVFPGQWAAPAAALIAVVVAATVLGLYIRTRRALLEQLLDRAERVERDRDQQVALAAAAERTRIAHEMHDIVAHHLTVMIALSDGAAAQTSTAPDRAAAAMRTASDTGRLALAHTRRLLGVLRDPDDGAAARAPLPELAGLPDLIDRVRAAGLPVKFDVEGGLSVGSPGVELALYRLVQEALTNTMKHAGPGASAVVRYRSTDDAICIEVVDDGSGTDAADRQPGRGRGLIAMRERVEAFGGELHSGPRSPRGWLVSARLPVDAGTRS